MKLKPWMKYLILVFYIVLLIILGILIAVHGRYTCVRKNCIQKANFILANMDMKEKPCNNFYKFACGNFSKVVKYRKYGFSSILDHIMYDIEDLIHSLLSKPMKITDDRILKIVKKMYQPCTNSEMINLGTQPLWDAIWRTGGFPVVEGSDWNEGEFSIGTIEYKSRWNGFTGQHLFQAYVNENAKNPWKYSVIIKPPLPPNLRKLPGFELVDQKYTQVLVENYLSFIVRLTFHLLGQSDYEKKEYTNIRKMYTEELNKTIEFKVALAKHLRAYGDEQDPVDLYNSMTLESLNAEFPYVDWTNFLQKMLGQSSDLPKDVVVVGTSYFRGIRNLIESTPKRVLANFFMLENILEGCLFLPQEFFSIYNKFRYNINLDITKRTPFCEAAVKTTLRGALSSLFLQTYNLTEGSQQILEEIANKMKKHIRSSIESLDWMDGTTKERAILKLKSTKLTLSLTDDQLRELQDEEARAKYYEDLCLGSRFRHVLPSYFCIKKFTLKKNWELLGRKPTVFDENVDVFTPEIKYKPSSNEILVPYGVLKFPAFDGMWPNYINFGGVGSVLGVAFTQGYDMLGASFNEMGYKHRWWSAKTQSYYTNRSDCYTEQYVKFATAEGAQLNENISLLESLSYFQGAHLALHAYLDYHNERYFKEQSLPGLEQFSAKQLFFISFANIHCSYYKRKRYLHDLRKANIPYNYKVLGSLRNSEEFSKAFGCKKKDQMNPVNQCEFLW